jgi:hypothetical protein
LTDDYVLNLHVGPPIASNGTFHPESSKMSVVVHFNQPVALTVGDSPLNVTSDGQPILGDASVVRYDSSTNDATFMFDGYANGMLPDGTYHATLPAGSVSNANGVATPADYTFDFTVLAADGDQSGVVDILDFNLLATNFGRSNQAFLQGNYDYSAGGVINILDFNVLALNFGKQTTSTAFATQGSAIEPGMYANATTPTTHSASRESTLLAEANLVAHEDAGERALR